MQRAKADSTLGLGSVHHSVDVLAGAAKSVIANADTAVESVAEIAHRRINSSATTVGGQLKAANAWVTKHPWKSAAIGIGIGAVLSRILF